MNPKVSVLMDIYNCAETLLQPVAAIQIGLIQFMR